MRVELMLHIAEDSDAETIVEVAAFNKRTEHAKDLGLSIAEAKTLLASLQQQVVERQSALWIERHRCCAACGRAQRRKGSFPVTLMTLYGDVQLRSQRYHRCRCKDGAQPATSSPLCALIPQHVTPERLYLEARWASLTPYAAAASMLADILPVAAGGNAMTLRRYTLRVAERAETELADERASFVDGCAADWGKLPIPEGRIVVGLDGGYVRNWHDRKSNFEVIVGRSLPEDREPRYVGLVHGHDAKPRRRVYDMLTAQGLQANQVVTFLTDDGNKVVALTRKLTPLSEHVLDWFHITMRITVLQQYVRGVANHDETAGNEIINELKRLGRPLWLL